MMQHAKWYSIRSTGNFKPWRGIAPDFANSSKHHTIYVTNTRNEALEFEEQKARKQFLK